MALHRCLPAGVWHGTPSSWALAGAFDRRKKKQFASLTAAVFSRLQVRRCRLLLHAGVVQLANGGESVFELFIPEHCGDTRLRSGPPHGWVCLPFD